MLNSIVILGRICNEPELRTTPSGLSVTSFTVAVDRSFAKSGEERQTDFIPVVAWRSTADFVTKYFHKGSMIAVQGSLQSRNYEDKQGNKRTAFEIVASEVSFCGGKNEGNSNSEKPNNSPATPTYTPAPEDFEQTEIDDDLPF